MKKTDFIHRVIAIVPANRCAALNTWVKNNIDSIGDDWFRPSLSTNGKAPATHAWASFCMNEQQCKKFLGRLSAMSGLAQPANWDDLTKKEKQNWLKSNRNAVKNSIGVWLIPLDNDGDWDDPDTILTAQNLKRI